MKVLAGGHQALRHHTVAQDFLIAVDVREEHLERFDSLFDAPLETGPFACGDDARYLVQRERSFLAGQREGDALIDERAPEGIGPRVEVYGAGGLECSVDALVRRTGLAVCVEHLVEGQTVFADIRVTTENTVCLGFLASYRFRSARIGLCSFGSCGSRTHPSHVATGGPVGRAGHVNFSRRTASVRTRRTARPEPGDGC